MKSWPFQRISIGTVLLACALPVIGLAMASCKRSVPERGATAPATATAAAKGEKPTAATAPGRAGVYLCRRAAAPLTIDGKADEKAWQQAEAARDFYLPWLGAAAPGAQSPTRARLLWDDQYLYFFADMEDADLHAQIRDHDGKLWTQDAFEIFLKPAADRPGYYEFQVNPQNAVLDMFLPSRDSGGYDRFKADGDFDITTAVTLAGTLNNPVDRDQGWSVEGRIAWKSFMRTGGRPAAGEQWTFALCRVNDSAAGETELSTTAALVGTPKPNFHRHEEYTPIRFVGQAPPATQDATTIQSGVLPPLTTSHVLGRPDAAPPYQTVRAYPRLQLPHPVAIARPPAGDQLLAIVHDNDWSPTRIVQFPDDPQADRYRTLLELDAIAYDIAFHPQFARNGYLYIGMNGPMADKAAKQTRIVRYTADLSSPMTLQAASAATIIEWESAGHNGGALDFGPDGMLYITSGDGSSDSDTWNSGQDLTRLLGKVLRIDVDHPEPGRLYAVPPDNPFVGEPDARPETWCYGLRNPWRMKFDPVSGRLWLAQNGQDLFEQVYLVQKGANYGWSASEGGRPFYPDRHRGRPITAPTVDHPHAEARSLTGGIVHHGRPLPELRGAYIYGDYATGKIWGIQHDGSRTVWNRELADTILKITGFGTNRDGDLLVLDHTRQGGIYRLEPAPTVATGDFPRTLSASGLFKSVQAHAMADGILPYSVNAELWSDGAYKERYIAIPSQPGVDRRIGFAAKGGFEFPDATVLVKSFAIERVAGRPESRQWIETRFLTRQQGEWVGYSYAWNADGTDASLVEAGGRDQSYDIADPSAQGGRRKQTWHFPSHAECMVCHSRVANYVLGPSLLQLNKDHDYGGGRVANQVRLLDDLGMLRFDKQRPRRLEDSPRLVDPYDPTADLTSRARSYLHANCANCHVEAGGGNAAMELGFATPMSKANLLDVRPLHDAMGVADARLIAPAAPERSTLLHRMSLRGRGQMPPLATHLVDERAVSLLREWIRQLPPGSVDGAAESKAAP